jgi:hypothetical protein
VIGLDHPGSKQFLSPLSRVSPGGRTKRNVLDTLRHNNKVGRSKRNKSLVFVDLLAANNLVLPLVHPTAPVVACPESTQSRTGTANLSPFIARALPPSVKRPTAAPVGELNLRSRRG